MSQKHFGPEFMKSHFYLCPADLKGILPEHNVHQGIQCRCGHKDLRILKRVGLPAIFAHCKSHEDEFTLYINQDYPAGYISDDPTQPLEPIRCNCGGQEFQVGVGYEYPGDESDSTDITWFTMVGKCTNCNKIQELFNDETG